MDKGRFLKSGEQGYRAVIEKISMETLVHGDKTLMAEFRLEAGAELPQHDHPHEQTGYLVSGRMDLIVGGETWALEPGDSWCIAGGVPHRAVVYEDSVAIEVFSPVREDYLH